MEKTPYEIRLEILKLASEHVRDTNFLQKEIIERQYDALTNATDKMEYYKHLAEIQRIQAETPKPYTLDDILLQAEKLRSFVDGNHFKKKSEPQLLTESGPTGPTGPNLPDPRMIQGLGRACRLEGHDRAEFYQGTLTPGWNIGPTGNCG